MKAAFMELLGRADAGLSIKERVVFDCSRFLPSSFSTVIGMEDDEQALRLYNMVNSLPHTITKAEFRRMGYSLADPPFPFPGRAIFKVFRGSQALLGKALSTTEYARAIAFKQACEAYASTNGGGVAAPHVMTFSVVVVHENPFMLMQQFICVVSDLPPLPASDTEKLFRQIMEALTWIHTRGFAHSDVKRANIGVNAAGNFFLIDLQSLVPFGHRTEATTGCVPYDQYVSDLHVRGSVELDHWMLATMIWESSGNFDYRIATEGSSHHASDDPKGINHGWVGRDESAANATARVPGKRSGRAIDRPHFEERRLGAASCWPTSRKSLVAWLRMPAQGGFLRPFGMIYVHCSSHRCSRFPVARRTP
jgi:hypothetical protein